MNISISGSPPKDRRGTTNKTNRIHQHAFVLRVGHRQKNWHHFPRIKRESWCSMPIISNCFLLMQPLLLLLLLLCLLQLSCGPPRFPPSSPPPCQAHRPSESVLSYPRSLGRKDTLTPRTGRCPPSAATPTSSPPAPPPYSRC